jgi:hypothetical protein
VSAAQDSLTQEEIRALPDSVVIGEALFRTLGYRTPDPAVGGLDVDLAYAMLVERIEDHPDRERAAARVPGLFDRWAEARQAATGTGGGPADLDPFDVLDLDGDR